MIDFGDLLQDAATRLGKSIEDIEAVKVYAAQRMFHLSTIIGQPGFDRALIAERDSVVLMSGIAAVAAADAADRELIGFITGILGLGAAALSHNGGGAV